MRKFLGQKWQNHNFGDKTVLKNLFSLVFCLRVIVGCINPRIQEKKFECLGKRDFYASLKMAVLKINP